MYVYCVVEIDKQMLWWSYVTECESVNCFQWFDDKQQEIETLDAQLKKLYSSVETLVASRKGSWLNDANVCST